MLNKLPVCKHFQNTRTQVVYSTLSKMRVILKRYCKYWEEKPKKIREGLFVDLMEEYKPKLCSVGKKNNIDECKNEGGYLSYRK